MLYREKLVAALEQKRDRFRNAERISKANLEALNEALLSFENRSQADIEAAIAGMAWPGARPTAEQDAHPLILPFAHSWANHEQARQWALDILRGVTTFAADGSQISSSRDISVPVGVVQVGWFENRHVDDGQGEYIKDVAVEVLSPDELAGEESGFADKEVEWRRFQAEFQQAEDFLRRHADRSDRALAFVDGSLVISFVSQMTPERQTPYMAAVGHLLDVSEETRVPLIGYVDTSYATDLTSLIARLYKLDRRAIVSDAAILRQRMSRWGDRARLYQCAREDRVLAPNKENVYGRVLFTYLKTTADNPPARVEMPAWVLDAGRQDWVMDVIRAECVVGIGYPYTLETADATAVLTMEDRERFLALFQQFVAREGIPLWFSKKALSKRGRRL